MKSQKPFLKEIRWCYVLIPQDAGLLQLFPAGSALKSLICRDNDKRLTNHTYGIFKHCSLTRKRWWIIWSSSWFILQKRPILKSEQRIEMVSVGVVLLQPTWALGRAVAVLLIWTFYELLWKSKLAENYPSWGSVFFLFTKDFSSLSWGVRQASCPCKGGERDWGWP